MLESDDWENGPSLPFFNYGIGFDLLTKRANIVIPSSVLGSDELGSSCHPCRTRWQRRLAFSCPISTEETAVDRGTRRQWWVSRTDRVVSLSMTVDRARSTAVAARGWVASCVHIVTGGTNGATLGPKRAMSQGQNRDEMVQMTPADASAASFLAQERLRRGRSEYNLVRSFRRSVDQN